MNVSVIKYQLDFITMMYYLGVLLIFGLAQASPALKDDVGYIEDIKASSGRVSGGWVAAEAQFPYQVSIRMINAAGVVSSCGGSIIDHEWVLTSAHCLGNRRTYIIRLGTNNILRPMYMLEVDRSDAYLHPEFIEAMSTTVQRDDIALIKLPMSIPYGPRIQPARLENSGRRDKNYAGTVVNVSGFGYDDDHWSGGQASDILLWVHLRAISNEECLTFFQRVYHTTVCARYFNQTFQSACNGDSGGPLTNTDVDGLPTVIGIVHYGSWRGCASEWPTAYVRPAQYHDWFRQVTNINFDWSFPSAQHEGKNIENDFQRL